jgi:VWFA-related protein
LKLNISFMQSNSNYNLISLVLWLGIIFFISTEGVSSQPTLKEQNRVRDFGKSLKKFGKKEIDNSPDAQTNSAEDEETIRVKTDLVVNDILITDQNRKTITNLKKDDFLVTEDSVPQTIEMFSPGENLSLPRSIVLVIDDTLAQVSYVRKSIEAAKLLVDKLNPNDKMAIVTGDVKLLVDFTQDKTLLKNTLDSLEKNTVKMGYALEFDALMAVLNEMFATEDNRRIVIFQGDGSEILRIKTGDDTLWRFLTSFLKIKEERWYLKRYLAFSDIQDAVERSRATIYSIIPEIRVLGLPKKEQTARARISLEIFRDYGIYGGFKPKQRFEDFQRDFLEFEAKRLVAAQKAMSKVAELSGGYIDFIEKPEDAEHIYSNILEQINNRYVIGYYPTNQERNGKRREVKIEVRNHSEYIVMGRKTYLAPEQ